MAADNIKSGGREAAAAVRDASQAFSELSHNGTIANQTLNGFIMLLGRMGPVGLVAAGSLSLIIGSLSKISSDEGKLAQDTFTKIAEAIQHQAEASALASASTKTFTEHVSEMGLAGVNSATIAQRLAKAQTELSDAQIDNTRALSELNEKGKDAASIFNTLNPLTKSFADSMTDLRASEQNDLKTSDETIAKKQQEIQVLTQLLGVQKQMETELARLHDAQTDLLHQQAGEHGSLMTALFGGPGEDANRQNGIARAEQLIQATERTMALEREKGTLDRATEEADNKIIADQRNLIALTQAQAGAQAQLAGVLSQLGTGAFDAYANAIDKTISMQNLLSESTGRAMQNVASNVLRSLGQQAIGKAMMATADGIVALAVGDYPTAGLDFEAAALYAGIAALAGLGAGALSVNAGGRGGSGGGGRMSSGNGTTVNQYVTVIGTLDDRDATNLQQQLAKARQNGDLAL